MFASHVPNVDALPWVYAATGERAEAEYDTGMRFAPRSEYDRVPTLPVNPILQDFRRLLCGIIGGWHGDQIAREAAFWWQLLGGDAAARHRYGFTCAHTDEHVAHARRVLALLAGIER